MILASIEFPAKKVVFSRTHLFVAQFLTSLKTIY